MTISRRTERSTGVPAWVDWIILLIIVGAAVVSIQWMINSGSIGASLTSDSLLSWHIARSAGLTSYILFTASTLWGLFLTTRVIKDWTPGTVSLLLHATASWLAVGLMVVHVGMLLFDKYYTYTIVDLFVPFIGPYRPFAVGLGILAAWLTVAITISFSLRKLIGQRAWRLLHYTSYLAFALITVHGVLAGTDMTKPGMWVVIGGFAALIVGLLMWRIQRPGAQKTSAHKAS